MSENSMKNIDYLEKLTETIKNNAFKDAEFSYTAKLIGDIEYLSKKIGEEASEVIIFFASSPICKFIVGVDLDFNDMFNSLDTNQ